MEPRTDARPRPATRERPRTVRRMSARFDRERVRSLQSRCDRDGPEVSAARVPEHSLLFRCAKRGQPPTYYGPFSMEMAEVMWRYLDPIFPKPTQQIRVVDLDAMASRVNFVTRTESKRTGTEKKLAADVHRLMLALGEARAEIARRAPDPKPAKRSAGSRGNARIRR